MSDTAMGAIGGHLQLAEIKNTTQWMEMAEKTLQIFTDPNRSSNDLDPIHT
jgi:hypothetical protein